MRASSVGSLGPGFHHLSVSVITPFQSGLENPDNDLPVCQWWNIRCKQRHYNRSQRDLSSLRFASLKILYPMRQSDVFCFAQETLYQSAKTCFCGVGAGPHARVLAEHNMPGRATPHWGKSRPRSGAGRLVGGGNCQRPPTCSWALASSRDACPGRGLPVSQTGCRYWAHRNRRQRPVRSP